MSTAGTTGAGLALSGAEPLPAVPSATDQLRQATASMRDTAKWVTAAFAGVAAVLVTGLQLSSIGQLSLDDPFLWLTLLCVLLALGSVANVIARATQVLIEPYVTFVEIGNERLKAVWKARQARGVVEDNDQPQLASQTFEPSDAEAEQIQRALEQSESGSLHTWSYSELIKRLQEHKSTLYGHVAPGLGQLQAAHNEAVQTLAAYQSSGRLLDHAGQPLDATATAAAVARAYSILEAVRQVVDFANHFVTRVNFGRLRRSLWLAAVLTVTGLIGFAWTVHRPRQPELSSALPVTVVFNDDPDLHKRLGAGCNLNAVEAVDVAGSIEEPDVITRPVHGCNAIRIHVSSKTGVAIPTPTQPSPTQKP